MSFVTDLEAKLSDVKNKVEGDLHHLILKLEAVFQRVHQSHIENTVKEAIVSDIHTAASHIEAVADTLRSDVSAVDKAVRKTASK